MAGSRKQPRPQLGDMAGVKGISAVPQLVGPPVCLCFRSGLSLELPLQLGGGNGAPSPATLPASAVGRRLPAPFG